MHASPRTPWIRRAFAAAAAGLLALVPPGLVGCARSGESDMSEPLQVTRPAIDELAPAHTETATFALG
jgi:hypothetical protein